MVALNGKINTVIQDDAVANITNKNRSARTRKSETALKCQWGVGAEDIPPVLGAGNRAGNIPTVRDPESCTHGIGQGRKIGRKIFRPYGCQFNDAVNMIGHYNVFMQNRIWKMLRDGQPTCIGNFSSIIQNHFTIDHRPKQKRSVFATDGDEIQARL